MIMGIVIDVDRIMICFDQFLSDSRYLVVNSDLFRIVFILSIILLVSIISILILFVMTSQYYVQ